MPKYPTVERLRRNPRASVWDPRDKKRIKGPVRATAKEAAQDAVEIKARLASRPEQVVLTGKSLTLQQAHELLIERCKRKDRSPETIDHYEDQTSALGKMIDLECPLQVITRDSAQRIVDRRVKDTSPNTAKKLAAHLARLIEFGIRNQTITVNVAKLIEMPDSTKAKRVAVDRDTILAAEKAARDAGMVLEPLIIALSRLTGCRLSELARMRVEHVDFDAGTLLVMPKVRSVPRSVTFPAESELASVLKQLIDIAPTDGKLIPGASEAIGKRFRKVAKLVGNPKIRTHAIRHGMGDDSYAATQDLVATGGVLGHSDRSLSQTMQYVSAPEDVVARIRKRREDPDHQTRR